MDIYLLLYLVFVVAPIGTALHEAGHAIGAKLFHADHISLSLGIGKTISSFSYVKIRIKINAIYFLGGLASSEKNNMYKPHELICIALCGPLSNGFFAGVIYILYSIYPNSYLLLLLLFNLWIAIVNMVPFQINGKKSDGYGIYRVLTQK